MQNNSRKKKSKRWIKRFPLLTNVLKNQQRIKEAIVESKMPVRLTNTQEGAANYTFVRE